MYVLWSLLLYAQPTDSGPLAFSLQQHYSESDPSTLSVKLMVEATTFIFQIWDALVYHMQGVFSPSGVTVQIPPLCQTQV